MAKKTPKPATELKRLDKELTTLLKRRYELAQAAAEGLSATDTLQLLAAEDERIEKVVGQSSNTPKSDLTADKLRIVLREVFAAERPAGALLRVAYLGPENTFSHLAAVHRFGAGAELVPVGAISAVFTEVDSGSCQLGVVPLENSTDGRVTDTLGCFAKTPVRICGELPLRIHHCLLGSGDRKGLETVCSKPQALSQCRQWLATHLPQAEARPVASTAEAARMAREDKSVGAIASERAAAQLSLTVLARNIEDQPDNITRFAVIGPEPAPPTKQTSATPKGTTNDKTALMFEMPHEPGALADAMGIFKRRKLNLTWIESFPIPGSMDQKTGSGRYLFFVEFQGHQSELIPRRAIADLEKKSTQLTVLGSYPQTAPIE